MAGVWKKTLNYLGLVEEDEDFVEDMPEVEPAPVRRMRPQAVREVSSDTEGTVRTIPSRTAVAATGAIHKSEPKRFNEARDVADRFKEGTAVIMNLQSTEDPSRAGSSTSPAGWSTGSTGRSSWWRTACTCSPRPTSRSRPRSANGSPAAGSTTSSELREAGRGC